MVERRRGEGGFLQNLPGFSRKFWAAAIGAWLGPVVLAWIQFELHWEPVWMFPIITVGGALATSYAVFSHATRSRMLRWPATTVGMAVFGLPLGLLAVALPLAHFNYHLTTVKSQSTNWNTGKTRTYEWAPSEPTMPETPSPLGDEVSALLRAFAEAEVVDIQDEIAAGKMRRHDDGSLVRVHPNGTETPIEQGAPGELPEAVDAAFSADARADAQRLAAERAEWNRQMDLRRKGGRLFSRPSFEN